MKRWKEVASWAWSVPPSHWLIRVRASPSSAASPSSRCAWGLGIGFLPGRRAGPVRRAVGELAGLVGIVLPTCVGETVGDGAGLDDLPGEGQTIDDRGAQTWVGEGLGPAGEGFVGGDGDRGAFLPLGENLEQQLGAAAVKFHVAQLVQADQIHPAVPGDQLRELSFVGGLDQLVDQLGRQGVTDPVAGLGGQGAQRDQEVGLAGAGVPDQAQRVAGLRSEEHTSELQSRPHLVCRLLLEKKKKKKKKKTKKKNKKKKKKKKKKQKKQ